MKAVAPLLLFAAVTACSAGEDRGPVAPPARDGFQPNSAWPGFLLVSPLKSSSAFLLDMGGETVHRWDTVGEPGNSVYLTDRGTIYRCLRVEEGTHFRGGGIGGRVQELAPDGTVLWDYSFADDERQHHHDIELLPNGNLLLIAWDRRTREEALARGRDPELLAGQEFWPGSIYEVRPLPPSDAQIVWEWHAWDHLIQDFDAEAEAYGVIADHPGRIDINGDRDPEQTSEVDQAAEEQRLAALGYAGGAGLADDNGATPTDHGPPPPGAGPPPIGGPPPSGPPPPGAGPPDKPDEDRARTRGADWLHNNAIDYNATLDQIVISPRRFDEIWIIDHSTTTEEARGTTGGRSGRGGDLLYRWGNPTAYGRAEGDVRTLVGQHDVQWIDDGLLGAGGLMAFSNGSGRAEGDWSSIEEWFPVRTANGVYLLDEQGRFGPLTADWNYEAPNPGDFFSSFISGVQRLPNGNTLICSGEEQRVFEVTPEGKTVWEWDCDLVPEEESEDGEGSGVPKNSLFRVTRIAADHPGLQAMRAAGVPIPESAEE